MDALLTALAGIPLAEWMRLSRWGYAGVNTLHVFGIALLVGAIIPLDLRLIGLRRGIDRRAASRLLLPVASGGLAMALGAGLLLFLADPAGYAAMPLFWLKLSLIALAIANALALTLCPGVEHASPGRLRLASGLSLLLWPAVLVCGRLLAFV